MQGVMVAYNFVTHIHICTCTRSHSTDIHKLSSYMPECSAPATYGVSSSDPDRLTFPLDLLLLPTALSLGGNWVLLLILLSTWVSGMYLAQSAVLRSVFVWLLSFITFLL